MNLIKWIEKYNEEIIKKGLQFATKMKRKAAEIAAEEWIEFEKLFVVC